MTHHQPPTRLHALEFRVFRALPDLRGRRIVVACSGGRDSVALVSILRALAPRAGFEIEVASVHHGVGSPKVIEARDKAIGFAKRVAGANKFHELRLRGPELKSEAALRDGRLRALGALTCDFVAFAHHADDLFETRLIRLLRGTGAQGLEAMSVIKGRRLRPLLSETRASIAAYATEKDLEWMEDPTNAESGPLRNWLRHEWLPLLETKRPGSSEAMKRSLSSISDTLAEVKVSPFGTQVSNTISRETYLELGIAERRSSIAAFLRQLGVSGYSSGHVDEIRKRIETRKSRAEFELLDLKWSVNARQICVVPCSE